MLLLHLPQSMQLIDVQQLAGRLVAYTYEAVLIENNRD